MNLCQSKNPDNTVSREFIHAIVSGISPCDALEKEHLDDTLAWMDSGAILFRMVKPDVPNKHLCSYCVLFDEVHEKILLVDHKKSGLWLPPGGHVDLDEDPKEAAQRECLEELGIPGEFVIDEPLFLTSTVTVGLTAGHTDISLWYVMKGDSQASYAFDSHEFHNIRWFSWDEIPYERAEMHLARFVHKWRQFLLTK